MSLLDEKAIRSFEVGHLAIEEAIRFGQIFDNEAHDEPDSVQCAPFPPDGIKVTLSRDDRRLILFFFGEGRVVFGKKRGVNRVPQGEGELSLAPDALASRQEILAWLAEPTASSQAT
ncbi:hypothetical protein K2X85_12995 [bacterium]|jgi:hypothetical protein|nr:hypothetical protein [bacterium]